MSPKIVTEVDFNRRESEIIETAIHILAEKGWKSFTMDRVVSQVPYSKGIVYKHFSSKEDLFVAITNEGEKKVAELSRKAISFNGNWREKYMAMGFAYVLYCRIFPVHFFCGQTAVTPAILEKASLQRIKAHRKLRDLTWELALNPVQNALNEGVISLPTGYTADDVLSATFYAECGCLWMILSGDVEIIEDQLDLEAEYFKTFNILIDGFQWKPLISEFDFPTSLKRIANEVFPEELNALIKQNLDFYKQLIN
ncbi:MAG: TetR/AcrR family transcriptional regulator [Desulfobacterales bacterium]|nr:TetR/AcrR family transcriptional regulator [Desulfobacterales bacterium]